MTTCAFFGIKRRFFLGRESPLCYCVLHYGTGGVTIAGGTFGTAINSGTGLIGIGHWSAGNMDIGTSATARTIEPDIDCMFD